MYYFLQSTTLYCAYYMPVLVCNGDHFFGWILIKVGIMVLRSSSRVVQIQGGVSMSHNILHTYGKMYYAMIVAHFAGVEKYKKSMLLRPDKWPKCDNKGPNFLPIFETAAMPQKLPVCSVATFFLDCVILILEKLMNFYLELNMINFQSLAK